MRSDAGWRKEDGLRDDMWRHQAWSTPKLRRVDESTTASACPYGLLITTKKEGSAWDAQPVEYYSCHLGTNTGKICSEKMELCYESFVQQLQPNSRAAKDARTGGLGE